MTWTETHQRWQILRDVETRLHRGPAAGLPWRPEYAALFGDRDGLAAALRYRWTLRAQAQLDSHLDELTAAALRERLEADRAVLAAALSADVCRAAA